MTRERFETAYQGTAPWDIPGPQPAFVKLQEENEIRGSVLDAGCGTGENALYLAGQGHEVWGVDFVPVAVERAREKAQTRGLTVRFEIGDALELGRIGRTFDNVIDCGLFHTFSDEDRPRYVAGLRAVLRPGGRVHLLCFSELEPPGQGPRRVTQQELRDTFFQGWNIVAIRETRFQTTDHAEARTFSPGGPHAWLATIARVDG